ncbi:MAG: hypothetical protein OXC09_05390 [Truepera sp.]|nr:hypothetical protein [Truepera sp.]
MSIWGERRNRISDTKMLDRLPRELKIGEEPFRGAGPVLKLLDYWRWSGSNLMDNTTRGMLAEFLVATALGLHETPRIVEWESYDLQTPCGTTVEVKSAAAIQSWKQRGPSPIEFDIAPKWRWDEETGQYSDQARRWADLYVFCVLCGADPLNVDKWEFYILQSAVLNDACPKQQRIRLNPLRKLSPRPLLCCYRDLKRAIEEVSDTSR